MFTTAEIVEDHLSHVRIDRIGGWVVPVCNVHPRWANDVASDMLMEYPDKKFAATYYDLGDGRREWLLFSREDEDGNFDVRLIASKYGGISSLWTETEAAFYTSRGQLNLDEYLNGGILGKPLA